MATLSAHGNCERCAKPLKMVKSGGYNAIWQFTVLKRKNGSTFCICHACRRELRKKQA